MVTKKPLNARKNLGQNIYYLERLEGPNTKILTRNLGRFSAQFYRENLKKFPKTLVVLSYSKNQG